MKRIIRASEDLNNVLQKISQGLYNFIKYDLWDQARNEYYKQIRKQFTVNNRKYVVKNDAKGRLHILSPEGHDFYGYSIPSSLYNDTTMDMALDIINDAYEGQELNNEYKRVPLNLRLNYKYGSGGVVSLGDYIKMLENHYEGYSGERYAVCTFRGDWASEISDCIGFDGAGDAIEYAQNFIKDGANTESYKQNEGTPAHDYTYKANVIDTRTGQEVWYDETKSIPLNSNTKINTKKPIRANTSSDWEKLATKDVYDYDGFLTEYSLWFNHETAEYATVFGDSDLYDPSNSDLDMEFGRNADEAWSWFENYETDYGEGDND